MAITSLLSGKQI